MPKQTDAAAILDTRTKTHGDFAVNAEVAQCLETTFYAHTSGRTRFSAVQREALHMIFHKLGRIAAGDPSFKDHWDDIAGYALLVARRSDIPSED